LAHELRVQRIRFELPDGTAATHEVHVHRTRVELPDGTAVTAVSFLGDGPYDRDPLPDFGLYLDERWDPPWAHEHVAWPDFGLPPDMAALRTALVDLLDRSRAGDEVELGCLGGHGRTGTALACLAVLTGTPAGDAVDWVRAHYCIRAVETDAQRGFVEGFGD
jgi:protein-tyrosine phosphatase